MASNYFTTLENSIIELKTIYLDAALSLQQNPTIEQQELARAFVVFAHAEIEYYLEEALRDLVKCVLTSATAGNFSKASISLLTFTSLDPLSGGSVLSAQKKKTPRQVASRIGEAQAALLKTIDSNNGAREKHIAAMAIPLGLQSHDIDNTWLNDLETFCSFRGAFVHMSRTTQRGNPAAVNPNDIWDKCKRLIWTNPLLTTQGAISSFESFDKWVVDEKLMASPVVHQPAWKITVLRLLSSVLLNIRRGRKKEIEQDDD